jgi:hypothetical protein
MVNIKSIWEKQKPTGNVIIKTKILEIIHLNCFAATNHITGQHLYIMNVSKNIEIPEIKNYKFKGVEIFIIELEEVFEFNIYLLENDLKDIFSLFIENIIEDILESITEKEALTKTLNVISKWKKLFDKINFQGLTIDQQKGLIGELLFINFLLESEIPISKILTAWVGPDFYDKDFVFGSIGCEIKFTSAKIPRLKITNERQLDSENLSELFLTLYSAEEVKENGFSLNSIVSQIRKKIEKNYDNLKHFNERLLLLGYLDEDFEYYKKMYSLKNSYTFIITSDFPKIIKSQLSFGIYNTSYHIELSAVERFLIENKKILKIFNGERFK